MGKIRGSRQKHRLADMSTPVQYYKPPPVPPAIESNMAMEITETDELRIRHVTWAKKIVDFAIMQIRIGDGESTEIARIDCCHSMIHRHQFTQDGRDIDDHLEIKAIPADGGDRWSIVHAGYYDALALMQAEGRYPSCEDTVDTGS